MKAVIEKKETTHERLSVFARNPLRPLSEKMAASITKEYQPEQIIKTASRDGFSSFVENAEIEDAQPTSKTNYSKGLAKPNAKDFVKTAGTAPLMRSEL